MVLKWTKLDGVSICWCTIRKNMIGRIVSIVLFPFFFLSLLEKPRKEETNESFRYFHLFKPAERPTVQLPRPNSDTVQQCGDRRPAAGFRYRMSHADTMTFFSFASRFLSRSTAPRSRRALVTRSGKPTCEPTQRASTTRTGCPIRFSLSPRNVFRKEWFVRGRKEQFCQGI